VDSSVQQAECLGDLETSPQSVVACCEGAQDNTPPVKSSAELETTPLPLPPAMECLDASDGQAAASASAEGNAPPVNCHVDLEPPPAPPPLPPAAECPTPPDGQVSASPSAADNEPPAKCSAALEQPPPPPFPAAEYPKSPDGQGSSSANAEDNEPQAKCSAELEEPLPQPSPLAMTCSTVESDAQEAGRVQEVFRRSGDMSGTMSKTGLKQILLEAGSRAGSPLSDAEIELMLAEFLAANAGKGSVIGCEDFVAWLYGASEPQA